MFKSVASNDGRSFTGDRQNSRARHEKALKDLRNMLSVIVPEVAPLVSITSPEKCSLGLAGH